MIKQFYKIFLLLLLTMQVYAQSEVSSFTKSYNTVKFKWYPYDTIIYANHSFIFNINKTSNIRWVSANGKVRTIVNVKKINDEFPLDDGSTCQVILMVDDDGNEGILQYSATQDWVRFVYKTHSILYYNKAIPSETPVETDTALGMKFSYLTKEELSNLLICINPNVVDAIIDKESYGFKVDNITRNSVAMHSGIQKDDIVFSVDDVTVKRSETLTEFSMRFDGIENDVKIKLMRAKKIKTIILKNAKHRNAKGI